MNKLLPIIDNVEFEHINGAQWFIIVEDVVCGHVYAEYFAADGYAYGTFDIKGMKTEDLSWTVYNYTIEYNYINPTPEELRGAILEAI